MKQIIHGSIVLSKRLRQHPVWSREAMSYGQALVDLLLLANDKARRVTINGETFELKRGQLAWSKRRLESEWNRSRNWVDRFLRWCNDESMIVVDSTNRRTIITIINYDVYQIAPEQTEGSTEV
ncbi:MAG TPA: hypothetical protein VHC44_07700 [Verrucomicrobiae bacterium]|nr:hypothetical protein [Verrucomicrobiae bacterium]